MSRTTIAAALGLSAALLVPATANAGEGFIPPVRNSSDPCASVEADFRQTVAAAQGAKQSAFEIARQAFLSATTAERLAKEQALRDAGSQSERRAAMKTYQSETADERRTLASAKSAAKGAFRSAIKSAQRERKAGMKACR